MKNAFDLGLAHRTARKGRKHDPSQGVAKRCAVTALERLNHESAEFSVFGYLGHFNFRFVKIKHSFSSVVRNRYEKLLFGIQLDDKHFIYRNIDQITGRDLFYRTFLCFLIAFQP